MRRTFGCCARVCAPLVNIRKHAPPLSGSRRLLLFLSPDRYNLGGARELEPELAVIPAARPLFPFWDSRHRQWEAASMSVVDELTRAVWGELDDLRKVVDARDMHENGGLRAGGHEFRAAWTKFAAALRAAGGVITNPQPGQGLASIWLRAIYQKAVQVEEAAAHYENGWQDVVRHNNDSLFWLVTRGWESCNQLFKRSSQGGSQLAALLQPPSRPMRELCQLAEEWTADFESAPNEPQGRVHNQWSPEERRRDEYLREAGELLLQAVDAVEISTECLEKGKEDFCGHFLKYMDTPDILVRSYLNTVSGEGLLEWVDSLEPRQGHLANDAVQRGSVPDPTPTNSYPTPHTYARDKWIYDNIEAHDCHSLSLKLKRVAKRNKWEIISSRNGLKKSADRYADSHGLPRRRYSGTRRMV
jgi:hypothetical protein